MSDVKKLTELEQLRCWLSGFIEGTGTSTDQHICDMLASRIIQEIADRCGEFPSDEAGKK